MANAKCRSCYRAAGDFRYRRTVFRVMSSSPAIPRMGRPAPFIS